MKQGRDLNFLVCLYPYQISVFLTLSKNTSVEEGAKGTEGRV